MNKFPEKPLLLLLDTNTSFDLFKSEVCHFIKTYGDHHFAEMILRYNFVQYFWDNNQQYKSFYCLAILDYYAYKYKTKPLPDYDKFRDCPLKDYLFPSDILILSDLGDSSIKEQAIAECNQSDIGKFFIKYKIVEKSIDYVV